MSVILSTRPVRSPNWYWTDRHIPVDPAMLAAYRGSLAESDKWNPLIPRGRHGGSCEARGKTYSTFRLSRFASMSLRSRHIGRICFFDASGS